MSIQEVTDNNLLHNNLALPRGRWGNSPSGKTETGQMQPDRFPSPKRQALSEEIIAVNTSDLNGDDYTYRIQAVRNRCRFAHRVLRLSLRALPAHLPPYSLQHWRIYDELCMEFSVPFRFQQAVWAAEVVMPPDMDSQIAEAIRTLSPVQLEKFLRFLRNLERRYKEQDTSAASHGGER